MFGWSEQHNAPQPNNTERTRWVCECTRNTALSARINQTIKSLPTNFTGSSSFQAGQVQLSLCFRAASSPCFIVPAHYVSSLLSCIQQLHVVSYMLFLIRNIISNFRPLVALPSVTSVRQEKSNYCILASRRACLHKSLSCSAVHSADVLFSNNCQRSEI